MSRKTRPARVRNAGRSDVSAGKRPAPAASERETTSRSAAPRGAAPSTGSAKPTPAPKLDDAHLTLLSAAAQRSFQAIVFPERMRGGLAAKIGAELIAMGFASEVPVRRGLPASMTRPDGAAFALVATAKGLAALGIDRDQARADGATDGAKTTPVRVGDGSAGARPGDATASAGAPSATASPAAGPTMIADTTIGRAGARAPSDAPAAPRSGTKLAILIDLLRRPDGVAIDAMASTLGWLPHTTRAALTGLRRRGLTIERLRDDGASRYRIVDRMEAAGAATARPDASAAAAAAASGRASARPPAPEKATSSDTPALAKRTAAKAQKRVAVSAKKPARRSGRAARG